MSSNNRDPDNITYGYKVMNQLVKEQNKHLLKEIARFKGMNEEETREFVEEYLKSNYYMLDITSSYKKEQQQRNFIY